MSQQTLDRQAAEEFAGHVIGILNGGTLSLLTSVGHKTGLFDEMAKLPPSTSEQIAEATGLNERYVREWLGGMTVGGIVEHDPDEGTYRLPAEHAASLTRAAGPDNLASMMQFVGLLAGVEDEIVDCFRNGGGVPYSSYPTFQRLMAEESAQVHDAALVDAIVPLVDGLPERLEAGIDACDVGCGQGHAVNLLAEAFPNSRFVGFDFSEEGIAVARAEAEEKGLDNARFEVRDVTDLGAKQDFDLVTAFDAIHDQAKPRQVLAGIAEALRDDGVFLMVDIKASSHLHENIDHPLAPALYAISTLHCMTVSLADGGEGLGTVWGEQQARELLAEAGLGDVTVKEIEGDIMNNYFIARKA